MMQQLNNVTALPIRVKKITPKTIFNCCVLLVHFFMLRDSYAISTLNMFSINSWNSLLLCMRTYMFIGMEWNPCNGTLYYISHSLNVAAGIRSSSYVFYFLSLGVEKRPK